VSPVFLLRLTLDLIAAGLLLVGLAYWWLGNAVHELAGTAMFLLLIVHNGFNRRWYGTVVRPQREVRTLFNTVATLVLLVAMLALLVTSVLISETLADLLPVPSVTARQIHILAAYWVLVIVAVHLGFRWPLLMATARSLLGLSQPNRWRTYALRLAAAAVAAHGVWSFYVLGIGTKLAMKVTLLDMWNFEESAAGFFVHCGAVAGLIISLTYYGLKLIRRPRRTMMKLATCLAAVTAALVLAMPAHAQSTGTPAPAAGQQTRAQMLMGDIAPKLAELTDTVLFGDIWQRPGLSKRDRSLVTVAALIALNRPDQLRSHLALARDNGVTQEELVEAITHLAFYTGWPNGVAAVGIARDVFKQKP
jgi:alkylhydroperoxidase/carboxymuconolactone decarboxylase family protein YurZ